MALVDFILNIAALLLWLNWRSIRFDPLRKTTATDLVGTLRPAQPRRLRGWTLLASFVGLLGFRALIYWFVGGSQNWIASLELGWVVLPFRADSLSAMALYSLLSFARVAAVFYFWTMVLVTVNGKVAVDEPITRLLKLHLGLFSRWPGWVQVPSLLVLVAAAWFAVSPLLSKLNMTAPAVSTSLLVQQGALLSLSLALTLKLLIPSFLLLHLVLSYVYLGNSPMWDFISTTGRNFLVPLRSLPLRAGRFDFSPLVGAALVLALLHWLPLYVQIRWPQ